MADGDKLGLSSNERLDLKDARFLIDQSEKEARRLQREMMAGLAISRVLRGFNFTIQTTDLLDITLGAGIFPAVTDAGLVYGQLISEGATTKTVNFGSLGAATFDVYARFIADDGDVQNRVVWDPGVPEEEIQALNTRKLVEWEALIASTSPGPEWVKILEVVWDGSDLNNSTLNDKRYFYFEGDSDAGAFGSDWGSGSDRDADRAANGVFTFERFAAAFRQVVKEIKGGSAEWFTAMAEGVLDKLSQNADALPGTNAAHNIGSPALKWKDLFMSGDLDAAGGFRSWLHARELLTLGASTSIAMHMIGYPATFGSEALIRAGSLIGVVVRHDGSGGTLDMDIEDGASPVFINQIIQGTTPVTRFTLAKDANSFGADALIVVRMQSDADWPDGSGTGTSEVFVTLEVES